MKLYTFWRSQAAFRVRIALNLKGLTHEDVAINLDRGDQFKPEYKAQNPQAVVPTLYDGNDKLFQSLAIVEYLEEKYPEPPILPKDLLARAWVRGFALINAADSHPLIVPRIRNYLADVLKIDEAARVRWLQHWLGAGLNAMEDLLAEKNPSGKFCHGDLPTIADICLVTQVTRRSSSTPISSPSKGSCVSTTPAWRSPRSPRSIRASSPISMGTETVASR
jgi:maleylacetoacetate isomerase